AGRAVAVAVRPDDPAAIPIAPHFLRRQLNEIAEQWGADVGNANGRLPSGVLDLPPASAVRDLLVLGADRSGIIEPGELLTPHQSWPGVAASLAVQGTIGPYWFLVRATSDLDQLVGI